MDLPELVEAVPEVSPDNTFPAVVKRMSESHARAAAVIENRKIVGIIAEQDVARQGVSPELETPPVLARDVMTTAVETMIASSPVVEAARTMRARRLQLLALVDDGGDFVGLVSLRRVLFEAMDELGLKVDNLERELMADGPGG